jgi:hypothetical protein
MPDRSLVLSMPESLVTCAYADGRAVERPKEAESQSVSSRSGRGREASSRPVELEASVMSYQGVAPILSDGGIGERCRPGSWAGMGWDGMTPSQAQPLDA